LSGKSNGARNSPEEAKVGNKGGCQPGATAHANQID